MPVMTEHESDCECVPCCDRDALRDNPIAQAERQEERAALATLTELERVAGPRIVGGVYRMGEARHEL